MEDRQSRLESKLTQLNRAQVWTGRFAAIALFIAALGFIQGLEIYFASGLNEVSGNTIADALGFSLLFIFCAWWLRRIQDGFSAIVDIIGELSETV